MTDNDIGSVALIPGDYLSQPQALRVDKRKIVEYLLNLDHPVGFGKAQFFIDLGFSLGDWKQLAHSLRNHAQCNKISEVKNHEFGTKYIVDCILVTPKNDSFCIRVVWNDHKDGTPMKLITAHPLS